LFRFFLNQGSIALNNIFIDVKVGNFTIF